MRESLATPPGHDNARLAAACVTVALLAAVLFGTLPYERAPFRHWDLASYREMADAAPRLAPDVSRHFAYRVLGPWLAGILPLPDPLAFRLLTTATLAATCAAFARFLRARGVPPGAVLFAVVAFAFNKHMFGYPAWNPFQIGDALAMLALVGLFATMLARRWSLFALIFAGGILARESVLLMVPTALLVAAGVGPGAGRAPAVPGAHGPVGEASPPPSRRRETARVLAAVAPGLALFVLLRAVLPVTGETTMLEALARHAPKLTRLETWLRLLVSVPAPLTFLPVIFWRTTAAFFRQRPWAALYLVLVFGSTLFGSNDERLMGPAFIVVYWLVAVIVARELPGWRVRAVLAGLVVVTSFDHLYARVPLPSPAMTAWLTALALAAATLAAAVAARRSGSATAQRSGPIGSRSPSLER